MDKRCSLDAYDPEEREEWLRHARGALSSDEVFVHYKGGVYLIERQNVRHTENEEDGVVYRHLWPHRDDQFWFRPQEMFFDTVQVDGVEINRFERVNFDAL